MTTAGVPAALTGGGGFRCAADAEARGELLAGTASRANRFVLVEFPTPWPHKAVDAFSDDVRGALTAACESAFVKLLLIRRPGEKRVADVRRWAVYDARLRRSLWGTWSAEEDLSSLVEAVAATPSDDWTAEPIVLVCTHARHDACCGVRGRPVAAAVAEAHGDVAWECTHVGGHRFAANLVLPLDGTYYGHLDPASVVDVIGAHLAKSEVSAEHLRGFSWMSQAAQAVAVEAHRRWGPAGPADVVSAVAEALGPDAWRVALVGSQALPAAITADVERVAGAPARLSCRADPTPTESLVVRTLLPREREEPPAGSL